MTVRSADIDSPESFRRLLRREAEILSRSRHPGVVELRAVTDTPEQFTVVTATPEGTVLAETSLTLEEVAGVCAVLATTVADLHDIGVAHRRIGPAAVVVAPDGRPVLDDFREATWIPGPVKRRPAQELARADDRALGSLLLGVLPSSVVDAAPRRRRLRPVRHRDSGAFLADIGARAADGRLTARALADAIVEGVPGARLPAARVPQPTTVGAAEDMAAVADDAVPSTGPGPVSTRARDEPPTATSGDEPFGGARRPPLAALLAIVLVSAATLAVLAHHHRGRWTTPPYDGVLVIGGHRYALGRPGDAVAVGRWWCGTATPAVLRPATGDVWVFDAVPTGTDPRSGRLVATVPGGVRLDARAAGGCDAIVVRRRDGTTMRVSP